MDQPIFNPPNPYVGVLRVFPGTLVKVSGRSRPNGSRFAINFQTGPSLNPRDDLALHLSPCFNPTRIVRNSLTSNQWGPEESWGPPSSMQPNSHFEIMILAEQSQFKIAINGIHYCEFNYRIPYHAITHLTIDGDVDLEKISISSSPNQTPAAPPAAQSNLPYPSAGISMPMPPSYPVLGSTSHNPAPSGYPAPGMPMAGGAPGYGTGAYPGAGSSGGYNAPAYPGPMPPGPAPGYPGQGGGMYPGAAAAGVAAGAAAASGYGQPHGSGHHKSGGIQTPFGNIKIPGGGKSLGALAGLGLGAAAGAAALSALNPVKHVKKAFKPKGFGGGWSRSSSNSSFSSNSS